VTFRTFSVEPSEIDPSSETRSQDSIPCAWEQIGPRCGDQRAERDPGTWGVAFSSLKEMRAISTAVWSTARPPKHVREGPLAGGRAPPQSDRDRWPFPVTRLPCCYCQHVPRARRSGDEHRGRGDACVSTPLSPNERRCLGQRRDIQGGIARGNRQFGALQLSARRSNRERHLFSSFDARIQIDGSVTPAHSEGWANLSGVGLRRFG
jgi:hypothetical protein